MSRIPRQSESIVRRDAMDSEMAGERSGETLIAFYRGFTLSYDCAQVSLTLPNHLA